MYICSIDIKIDMILFVIYFFNIAILLSKQFNESNSTLALYLKTTSVTQPPTQHSLISNPLNKLKISYPPINNKRLPPFRKFSLKWLNYRQSYASKCIPIIITGSIKFSP